jgi:hypothetical protein
VSKVVSIGTIFEEMKKGENERKMKESTLIKNKIKLSSYIRKFRRIGCKSYITNNLLINGENICAFPHILGSPSSYMTFVPLMLFSAAN